MTLNFMTDAFSSPLGGRHKDALKAMFRGLSTLQRATHSVKEIAAPPPGPQSQPAQLKTTPSSGYYRLPLAN